MEKKKMEKDLSKLKKKVFIFFILCVIGLGLMFFLPAGSLKFWQAWLFMGILFIPLLFVASYLLKHDPELLERRMRFREKEAREKTIIKIANLIFFAGLLIPGLDYRYGWSNVPAFLCILSDVIVFLGYMLVFLVFRENSYASRIIEVDKEQKVITTGPYSVIRHPMYTGVILMYSFMPVALGSYFALIFFIPIIPIVILRALDEEKVLLRDLKGYKAYKEKVKYRLIPGIW